jgi:hypothetical protein
MNCSVFVGCSFTQGVGFELLDKEPGLWVNLLHSKLEQLSSTTLINNGVGGFSNEQIFYTAVNSIITHQPKYIFVQWTSSPRYTFLLGVETYSTNQYFSMNNKLCDVNLHSIKYSKSYLENIRNRFLSLHHPHSDIVNIIKYTSSLILLAKKFNSQIFFINGLCPWDQDFFTKLTNTLPDKYTKYTQKILETDTRDDQEIFLLYDKIHSDYTQAGSIQESYWLNLYQSLRGNMLDTNSDNKHPGLESNFLYFSFIKKSFLEKI